MKDAVSQVKQYDYEGQLLREIKLPGIGSAGGFSGKKKTQHCIILSQITTPGTIYAFRPKRELLLNIKNQK